MPRAGSPPATRPSPAGAGRSSRSIRPPRPPLGLTAIHAPFYEPILSRLPLVRPVVQPANRGTALGVLYPALLVAHRDPSATVAVFPSDHFVASADRFMDAVSEAALVVER